MDESMDLADFLGELSICKRISSISEDSVDDVPVSKLKSFKSAISLSGPPYTGPYHTSPSHTSTSLSHTSPAQTSTSKDIPRKPKQRSNKNHLFMASFDEKCLKKNGHKEKRNTHDHDLHKQASYDERAHNGLHNQLGNFEEEDNVDELKDELAINRNFGTRPKREKIRSDKKKLSSPTIMSLPPDYESTTSVSWPTLNKSAKLSRKDTEWLEDSATKVCMSPHCQSKFTITLRKHHCRSCGKIYCKHCCRLDRNHGFRVCLVCNSNSTLVKVSSAHW